MLYNWQIVNLYLQKSGSGKQSEDAPFVSLLVLEFEADVAPSTIEWVLTKLVSSRTSGGGNLLARTVTHPETKVNKLPDSHVSSHDFI